MICTGEKDVAAYHFAHDAANRPQIHVFFVSHTQDDFWCPIVTGHDVGRHHEICSGCASQTEVQNFESAVWLHNYVAGF